jgi:hypothetical protein
MSSRPPAVIDGAIVKLFAVVGASQEWTGATRHSVDRFDEIVVNLAIAQYQGDRDFCLFYCTSDWEVAADTFHSSEQEAMVQAEFEFTNLSFSSASRGGSGRPG